MAPDPRCAALAAAKSKKGELNSPVTLWLQAT